MIGLLCTPLLNCVVNLMYLLFVLNIKKSWILIPITQIAYTGMLSPSRQANMNTFKLSVIANQMQITFS